MAFWTDPQLKEPLRQHRWFLKFNDAGLDTFTFALKECKKPEYEINVTEHRLLTQIFKFPGILKWKPIDIKIVSAMGDIKKVGQKPRPNRDGALPFSKNSANQAVESFIYKLGYRNPGLGHQEMLKVSPEYYGEIDLYQIDEDGNTLEEWKIFNPIVTSVSYGNLSYENEGFLDISLNIAYDYATLNNIADGLGLL